jgi:hypothetical protein
LRIESRVAGEDQRSVFIATFAYEESGRGHVACLSVLSGDSSPPAYATLTVHLHDPLGSRELLDLSMPGPISSLYGSTGPEREPSRSAPSRSLPGPRRNCRRPDRRRGSPRDHHRRQVRALRDLDGSDALVRAVCASSPHGGDLSADELARIARSLHS